VRRLVLAAALLLIPVVATGAFAGSQAPVTGWLTFGNGAARTGASTGALVPSSLRSSWTRSTEGMDTVQPLVAQNVPSRGQATAYVVTGDGRLIAYAPNGYVRWQRSLGTLPNPCPQLSEWGITGTPVIDVTTRAIYVADAFGLLHALDLATGVERPGWPVLLYADPGAELVWGALADVDGSIYVGTGSFCDRAMEGKLVRVEIADRHVSSFTVVPKSLGGGGSIWGWGGVSYSAKEDALFVVTGNAFEGGTNVGPAFSESAGYGEHLVEFDRNLDVIASYHPAAVKGDDDLDFVGSPVLFTVPGCPETVAAVNKDGLLFLWHAASIGDGTFADVALQKQSDEQPLLTQPAYDPATRSVVVSTFSALVSVRLDGCSAAHIAWKSPFANATLQGSPTVAGSTVWVALSGAPARLRGYDGRTGRVVADRLFGGMSFAPPSILGGRLYEGARQGFTTTRPAVSRPQAAPSALRAYTSTLDGRHRWQSRENGVFSTDNGGRTWRRIYPTYAQRVLRLPRGRGVISVTSGSGCHCDQRQLWTSDGGRHWHETHALAPAFTGSGSTVYSWNSDTIREAAWPPVRSHTDTTLPEEVADLATIPGGVVALLTDAGKSWDNVPRVAIVRGKRISTDTLPDEVGQVTARSLSVAWPTVVVRTYVFTDRGRVTVHWRSVNGGKSWRQA
jgi:hypothetical protein